MTRVLDSAWARAASLTAALALMGLVTLFPRALTVADGSPIGHGMLTLIMWGLSAGFVHGVGFVPRHRLPRLLFSPAAAWAGMGLGLSFYLRYFAG